MKHSHRELTRPERGAESVPDPRLADPKAEGLRTQKGRKVAHEEELARLHSLAKLMDSRFGIPGTRFSFGYDSVVGLIPGVGDLMTLAPQAYLIWRAHQLGIPRSLMGKMVANAGIDTVVGSIPLLGDLFDIAFKANLRNIRLLRQHLEKSSQTA